MRIGFTGTRWGMTPYQMERVRNRLCTLSVTEVHSGDCVGADAEFHAIATAYEIRTIGHPPDDPKLRAFCAYSEEREPESYDARNRAIVNESEQLIACPREEHEVLRSGTWSTVRYAADRVPVVIYYPGGEMEIR